jgi:hypothetical protein
MSVRSAEGAPLANATAPYIWLGPRWYAWLEFGPGGSHAAFERLAGRLCGEFGGVRAESLPNPAAVGKEYLYLRFGPSELLLMRRDEWTALGAFYPDVPLVLRIGAAFGAVRRGWRWPMYRAWGRLAGHRKTSNQAPQQ